MEPSPAILDAPQRARSIPLEASPGQSRPDARPALALLVLALLPASLAVWLVPGFVTQDGPAHVYNAEILRASLHDGSPYAEVFAVRWEPLPNWAGHLALIGLLEMLPARAADRVLMTLTLVGFAASIAWLRLKVAGPEGMVPSALLAALLGMNLAWLFGFYSFLLGATLFALTLGVWWARRDRPGPGLPMALAALLSLGYFCHPVSLGLTVGAIGLLALTTPGPGRGARIVRTLLAGLPLLPLAVVYRAAMGRGGSIEPIWVHVGAAERLAWVDPITLGMKSALPFVPVRSVGFGLLQPVVLLILGLVLLAASARLGSGRGDGRFRGWRLLAAGLLLGGLIGPDSLGHAHGFYLAQRVMLLGLVAVVPLLPGTGHGGLRRLGIGALGLAVALQAGFVLDYGRHCARVVGPVERASSEVGRGVRLGALWLDLRGPFRANPLLHAETLLGPAGNIVWSNYEAAHYYFPVQMRPDAPHPHPLAFEEISIRDSPEDAARRAEDWRALLADHADRIDVLLVRGREPTLDAITALWYETTYDDPGSGLRVLRRRTNRDLSCIVQSR